MATKVTPFYLQLDTDGGAVERTRKAIGLIGSSLALVWVTGPSLLLVLLASTAVQALLSPVQLFAIGRAVQAVATGQGRALWVSVLVASLVATQLVAPLGNYVQAQLGDRFSGVIRQRLLDAVNAWPGAGRFEDPQVANDLDFAVNESAWAGHELVTALFGVGLQLLTAVGSVALLAGVAWWLPPVVLVAELPVMALVWQYNHDVGGRTYWSTLDGRVLRYMRSISLAANEAKDLRLTQGFDFLHQRYAQAFQTVNAGMVEVENRSGRRMAMASAWSTLGAIAVIAWLAQRGASASLTAGQVAVGFSGYLLLRGQLGGIAQQLGHVPLGLQVVPILRRLLDAGPDLPLADASHAHVAASATDPPRVEFDHVGFTYEGTTTPVLRDVSFVIEPGQTLALVGHNGSGKTTLIKLLLRFHDVSSGRVLVDGVDIRDWDVGSLRARMGALFQDFARWEFSVADNIGLGDVAHVDDRERIVAAARAGNAEDFIAELPGGYDTRVGNRFGNRNLSGGQWQRLGLSRATMSRAGLLVLDEPTAELDPRAEAQVFDRFTALAAGRTIILVSHRFSTVRTADSIVLLDDGLVREQGSHAALMARDGEYARMFRLQASQYVDLGPGTLGEPNNSGEPSNAGERE